MKYRYTKRFTVKGLMGLSINYYLTGRSTELPNVQSVVLLLVVDIKSIVKSEPFLPVQSLRSMRTEYESWFVMGVESCSLPAKKHPKTSID
ncbi:hypothetical protein JTE90_016059 [Oedothorax gibbosus]|uniref:Uncharacterized protein n=1 Tax=Oedothorax gibbosus TaxID=931172 RepID=A0AAV6TK46_9ARAC|nr:hypothetical protein JTE90_016059 [Oedothorax gibbosus]